VKPAPFNLHKPKTLRDVVHLLSELEQNDARILAGGQSLVPMMAFRLARPSDLIDISGVEELNVMRDEKDYIEIGALVRHAALMEVPDHIDHVTRHILSLISHNIAHHPIRTRGTFCGSIAHADPSSEWCLAAVTLDALIIAQSAQTMRHIPAHEFFMGTMTTHLNSDEIITAVRIPKWRQAHYGFKEFSRRKGDFCLAAVLAVARFGDDHKIAQIHIGIGGVENNPRRMKSAESLMLGCLPSHDIITHAADLIAADLDPLEDKSTSADYRRELAHALVIDVLRDILL
jgi:aerobic carbon-monoxide dehydrogenase medium subunit